MSKNNGKITEHEHDTFQTYINETLSALTNLRAFLFFVHLEINQEKLEALSKADNFLCSCLNNILHEFKNDIPTVNETNGKK